MMKRSLILSFLLLVAASTFAVEVEIDGLWYDINEKTGAAKIIQYKNDIKYTGNIVIPKTVDYENETYNVTSIGEEAFYECSGLTSVTIPNSVTSIWGWAFYECSNLTSVTIGNGVSSIGRCAFFRCSNLTSVSIGKSVTSIGSNAFEFCSSLTSVTIPNKVTNIVNYAFSSCNGMTSVTIGNNVTNIGDAAFQGCSLTSIRIPNSVKSIGRFAFREETYLQEIVSKIKNPFVLEPYIFNPSTYYEATLYVPLGTIDMYKATVGWMEFYKITEDDPSRISNIESERANELRRYTLDGRVIKGSHNGINIFQMNDGTTKKVIVR